VGGPRVGGPELLVCGLFMGVCGCLACEVACEVACELPRPSLRDFGLWTVDFGL